jgi:hypothetical protein
MVDVTYAYYPFLCCQVTSLEEFREGCRLLNKNLHPDYQLTDIDHTLKLMDFDGSGTIDINEFFEVRSSVLCRGVIRLVVVIHTSALRSPVPLRVNGIKVSLFA